MRQILECNLDAGQDSIIFVQKHHLAMAMNEIFLSCFYFLLLSTFIYVKLTFSFAVKSGVCKKVNMEKFFYRRSHGEQSSASDRLPKQGCMHIGPHVCVYVCTYDCNWKQGTHVFVCELGYLLIEELMSV